MNLCNIKRVLYIFVLLNVLKHIKRGKTSSHVLPQKVSIHIIANRNLFKRFSQLSYDEPSSFFSQISYFEFLFDAQQLGVVLTHHTYLISFYDGCKLLRQIHL